MKENHKFLPTSTKAGWFLGAEALYLTFAHVLISGPKSQARCLVEIKAQFQQTITCFKPSSWFLDAYAPVFERLSCDEKQKLAAANVFDTCTCPSLICQASTEQVDQSKIVNRHLPATMKWNVKQFGGSKKRKPDVYMLDATTANPYAVQKHTLHDRNHTDAILQIHARAGGSLATIRSAGRGAARGILEANTPAPHPSHRQASETTLGAWFLPSCPPVPLDFFISQLCRYSRSPRNSTAQLEPNQPAYETYGSNGYGYGASNNNSAEYSGYKTESPSWRSLLDDYAVSASNTTRHNISQLIAAMWSSDICIEDFSDSLFADFPYEFPCRRDCLLSAWSLPSECISPAGCSALGRQNRTRHVLIPSNSNGQCKNDFEQAEPSLELLQSGTFSGTEGLTEYNLCPTIPCQDKTVIEGQVTLTRVNRSQMTTALFSSSLATAIDVPASAIQVYRVDEVLLDTKFKRALVQGPPMADEGERSELEAIEYDYFDSNSSPWSRERVGLSVEAARRFLRHSRSARVQPGLAEDAEQDDVLIVNRQPVEWHNSSEPAGEMLRRVLADNFTAVTVSFGVVFSTAAASEIEVLEANLKHAFQQTGGTFQQALFTFGGPVIWIVGFSFQNPQAGAKPLALRKLRILQQPGDSVGGELMFPQPTVELVLPDNTTATEVDGNGAFLLVQLQADSTHPSAPVLSSPSGGIVRIHKGLANFSDLQVSSAGQNLRLIFYTIGQNITSLSVVSEPFNSYVGPLHRSHVLVQPGGAKGGRAFSPQPVIELQDKASNRISIHHSTTVNAFIHLAPTNGDAMLLGDTAQAFRLGQAAFHNLRLNKAGGPYVIGFNVTNRSGIILFTLLSSPFSVAVGPTAQLKVARMPALVHAGSSFSVQPRIELQDAGGNINVFDNSSRVFVELLDDTGVPTESLQPVSKCHPVHDVEQSHQALALTASVNVGALFMYLSSDPSPANSALANPLKHGDSVYLADAWTSHSRILAPTECTPASNRSAIVQRVRSVLGAGEPAYRLRLLSAWRGPAVRSGILFKLVNGLVANVDRGVAQFTDLSVNIASSYLQLIFISSLEKDGMWLSRGRPGQGLLGHGYGWSSPTDQPSDPLLQTDEDSHSLKSRIYTISSEFVSRVGVPSSVKVQREARLAFADGTPFGQQPCVSVFDKGMNHVKQHPPGVVSVFVLAESAASSGLSERSGTTGNTAAELTNGTACFHSLGVHSAFNAVRLVFQATIEGYGTFAVNYHLALEQSMMSALHPFDGQDGDRFGQSVAIDGGYIAVGCPRDTSPIAQSQRLEVCGLNVERKRHVQLVRTLASEAPALQTITIPQNETQSGVFGTQRGFQFSWMGVHSPVLDAQWHSVFVENLLTQHWRSAPKAYSRIAVDIHRTEAAIQYKLTFFGAVGVVELVEVAGPVGATVVELQAASVLQGSFSLFVGITAEPDSCMQTTTNIRESILHDASDIEVASAVQRLYAYDDIAVSRTATDQSEMGSYKWTITFGVSSAFAIRPGFLCAEQGTLHANAGNSSVVSYPAVLGEGPTTGFFQLKILHETSADISVHSSASNLASIVNSMPAVQKVEAHSIPGKQAGCRAWLLVLHRFVSNNSIIDLDSNRGLSTNPQFELEFERRLWSVSSTSRVLGGSHASVTIGRLPTSQADAGTAVRFRQNTRVADVRLASGSVYVFPHALDAALDSALAVFDSRAQFEERIHEQRNKITIKSMRDSTKAHAMFGAAVAMHDGTLAVGAPYSVSHANSAVFGLQCSADMGVMQIKFRNQLSAELKITATSDDIETALRLSLDWPEIRVVSADQANDPICRKSPATFARSSKERGSLTAFLHVFFPYGVVPNDLTLDSSQLLFSNGSQGFASLTSLREGRMSHAEELYSQPDAAVGSVHIFEREVVNGVALWENTGVLRPTHRDIFHPIRFGDWSRNIFDRSTTPQFGQIIEVFGHSMVVGAPGDSPLGLRSGSVYVFRKLGSAEVDFTDTLEHANWQLGGGWLQQQRIHENHTSFSGGVLFEFGSALAMESRTLVVSSTGPGAGAGVVSVFQRHEVYEPTEQPFLPVQRLQPGDWPMRSGEFLDGFGKAISISGNELVVGAPSSWVQSEVNAQVHGLGCILIYRRSSDLGKFRPVQRVTPITARPGGNFGASLALAGNLLAVSSLMRISPEDQTREIQAIRLLRPLYDPPLYATAAGDMVSSIHAPQWPSGFSLEIGPPDTTLSTPLLPFHASANQVLTALDLHLGIQQANISRAQLHNPAGYEWLVTFAPVIVTPGLVDSSQLHSEAPLLRIRISSSKQGLPWAATVSRKQAASMPNPAVVSILTTDASRTAETEWTHDAQLVPHQIQGADQYGSALALSKNLLVSGAPARVAHGAASGAVVAHDLRWTNLRIHSAELLEGQPNIVNVSNCIPGCTVLPEHSIGGAGGGRNQAFLHSFDGDDFGWLGATLHEPSDIRQQSSAHFSSFSMPATSQSFGCNVSDPFAAEASSQCQWIRIPSPSGLISAYDIHGLSDFVPRHQVDKNDNNLVFQNHSAVDLKSVEVVVSADDVVEVPDETFRLILAPDSSIYAVPGGRLQADCSIADDTDGGVDTALYTSKLLPSQPTVKRAQSLYSVSHGLRQNTSHNFGRSISFEGDFIFSAEPGAVSGQGSVAVFRVVRGGVINSVSPIPLQPSNGSLCGASLDSTCIGDCGSGSADTTLNGEIWVVIGCPGVRSFEVWSVQVGTSGFSSNWVLQGSGAPHIDPLHPSSTSSLYFSQKLAERTVYHNRDNGRTFAAFPPNILERAGCFSSPKSVAITSFGNTADEIIVHAGCPSLDATFVFRPLLSGVWRQTAVLLSPWTEHTHLLGVPVTAEQSFGYSLSSQDTEILIGAPQFYPPGISLRNESARSVAEQVARIKAAAPGAAMLWSLQNCSSAQASETWKLGGREFFNVPSVAVSSHTPSELSYCNATLSPCLVADAVGGCWQLTYVFEDATMANKLDMAGSELGSAVSLDVNLIAIGAPAAQRQRNCTWNFETGDTRGWHLTGAAFEGQPSFGSNPSKRAGYMRSGAFMAASASKHEGSYMLSSYDSGSMNTSAQQFVTAKGDAGMGRAASMSFTIAGPTISLLVGGGCEAEDVFVRLIVDGTEMLRSTASCETEMKRAYWDVSAMRGLSAYIEVVDNSDVSPWGHIAIDDVRFAWPQQFALAGGPHGSAFLWAREQLNTNEQCRVDRSNCTWRFKQHLQPTTTRPFSQFGSSVAVSDTSGLAVVGAPGMAVGASSDFAYSKNGASAKPSLAFDVKWGTFGLSQSRSLFLNGKHGFNPPFPGEASDFAGHERALMGGSSHSGNVFGFHYSSSDVDTQENRENQYKETLDAMMQTTNAAVYDSFDLGSGESPRQSQSWEQTHKRARRISEENQGQIGGVFIFRRTPESRGGHKQLQIRPATWDSSVEQAELVPPGLTVDAKWGSDVALDKFGRGAIVSAPADPSAGFPSAGAVWFANMSVVDISFAVVDDTLNNVTLPQVYHDDQTHLVASVGSAVKSFVFSEGDYLKKMVIPVYRHGPVDTVAHMTYSTTDITARGVPKAVIDACARLPFLQRGAALCGDYQASAGVLTFMPTRQRMDIEIPLMDDACYEPERKVFVVKLSVPGGLKLRGADYRITVSITDDDAAYAQQASVACPRDEAGDSTIISKAQP